MKFKFRLHVTTETWVLIGILIVFGAWYSCISLVNHCLFRTYAHDLSYYSHAIYQFSEFRYGTYILANSEYWHTFGDHFEPILMLIAPFRYLFGTLTLLILQIAAILFGAVGLYRYVKHRSDRRWLPHIAAVYFCSFWGIFGALSFDFHAIVLGAMFLPWAIDEFERKHWRAAGIFFLLFIMCGEKAAFWGFFIGLGMLLLHRRDRQLRLAAMVGAGFAMVWFLVAMKFIIPYHIHPDFTYRHFRLRHWGGDLPHALMYMLEHPVETFRAFFFNHLPDNPYGNHLKMETHKMVLLSGGLILLWRPQYLIMLIPVYVGKMLNDLTVYWGINAHYSIEFVPIVSIAVFAWILRRKNTRLQYALAGLVAALTLTTTVISFSTRYKEHNVRENQDIFYHRHWEQDVYEARDVYEGLALIPPDVPVSASDRISPHLTMRDKLYRFPWVNDAEYVIISHRADTYPIGLAETREIERKMIEEEGWEVLLNNDAVSVLKRPPGL